MAKTPPPPVLLDVTRLIATRWSGHHPNGIDRVCYAYLRHFRHNAFAVAQHKGAIKTLNRERSDTLFDLLLCDEPRFRTKLLKAAPYLLLSPEPAGGIDGLPYVNVSHTDFDLEAHFNWVQRHNLHSTYLIHDLIPIIHPHFSRPHAVARHAGRVQSALRFADQIIVSTKAVANDLKAYAIAQGLPQIDPIIAPLASGSLNHHLPNAQPIASPYFVCLGTIEPRKNHELLIQTWRKLIAKLGPDTPKLILIGKAGPMTGDILDPLNQDALLNGVIEWRPDCPDHELAPLLAHAKALLFPSMAEGCGLPLVEALEIGTKVIASDIAAFREIGQNVPEFLPPDNVRLWANAILDCIDDKSNATDHGETTPFIAPHWHDHFALVDEALKADRSKNTQPNGSDLAA